MTDPDSAGVLLHATSVAVDRAGVLILGPSGSGKSSLALALLSLGARLIADDRTIVRRRDDLLWASVPPTLSGRIEARGVGILGAEAAPPTPLRLIVDMGQLECGRLPPLRGQQILGVDLPCLHKNDGPHFHMAIWQYMKAGRIA